MGTIGSRVRNVIVTRPSGTLGCKAGALSDCPSLNGKERSLNVTSQDRTIAQVLLFQSW